MQILLTNDDGIHAPGLLALHAHLQQLGTVHVVAPQDVQSAMSHSVTFHRSVATRSETVQHPNGTPAFTGVAVDGRPADCTRLGLRYLTTEPIDLVVSGMNSGANVGTHVIYSGTVSAAVEAAFAGVSAAAISLHIGDWEKIQWDKAASLAVNTLKHCIARGIEPGTVANINVPILDDGDPIGERIVPVSLAPSQDEYDEAPGDQGERCFTMRHSMAFPDRPADTDVACLYQRHITISPLHFDRTDHNRLHAWQDALQSYEHPTR